MTSNTVVAKRDFMQMCLAAAQFKSSVAAVAESVALFTLC